jgi:hypothetical protein
VGGPSDQALDRMIGPQSIHLAQAGSRAPFTAPPSQGQVAGQMKPAGRGRVCLHDLTPEQACILTFLHENAGWRLVAMPGSDLTIELAPEPAKGG